MSSSEQTRPPRRRWPWVHVVVLVLLGVALSTLMLLRTGGVDAARQHRAVGLALPALELVPLTGRSTAVTLRDLAGKVTLVNFWATWCPPCRRELPDLAALALKFADEPDFRLLAVCTDRGAVDRVRPMAEATLAELDVKLPNHADPEWTTRRAFDRVAGFDALPTTFVLDGDGIIRGVWLGYSPSAADEMERLVRELLANLTPTKSP